MRLINFLSHSNKIFGFLLLAIIIDATIFAQSKPALDISALLDWKVVSNVKTSNDGEYIAYDIMDRGDYSKARTLMVQSLSGKWSTVIENGISLLSAEFTSASHKFVFKTSSDSLCIMGLGKNDVEWFPNVKSFKLFTKNNEEWLCYQLISSKHEWRIRNLRSKKETSITGVIQFEVARNLGFVLLKKNECDPSQLLQLAWLDPGSGEETLIWQGKGIQNIVVNETGTTLAFSSVIDVDGKTHLSFWLYDRLTKDTKLLLDDESPELLNEFHLGRIYSFGKNSKFITVSLTKINRPLPIADSVNVNIWSYNEPGLKAEQLSKLKFSDYQAIVNINNGRLILTQDENTESTIITDDFIYKCDRVGSRSEINWNMTSKPTSYIISVIDGYKRPVEMYLSNPRLTSDSLYIIGSEGIDIYSCELKTGIVRNLTRHLYSSSGEKFKVDDFDEPYNKNFSGLQFSACLPGSGNILVHDEFDIWEIDVTGILPTICVTNGFGRKNNIRFRLNPVAFRNDIIFTRDNSIIVSGFDKLSKNQGFYKIKVSTKADPQLLSTGPYVYTELLKPKKSHVYFLRRESAHQSPNFFNTSDFKKFVPISTFYPEQKFNWLTAKLMDFTTADGTKEQGILYRPENFDSTKHYPVIVHYYERKSQDLNSFRSPDNIGNELAIPWFVSHGYCVFVPDIHYTIGNAGQSALNTIVGSANWLGNFSWVNVNKIGLQGHSWGGYETNFIVTHSDIFSAAMSSCGPSDLISNYGYHSAYFSELSQNRIGATPWERPDLYLKNSPIFFVDKVTTPILMMATTVDYNVPFDQSLEFFTALRRLGKRVWMLEYADGHHSVGGKSAIDNLIRMTQFFDHYLKDSAAPTWMTGGVSASLKGLTLGYEKDTTIKTPPEGGLLTEEEKKKLEAMKNRIPITVIFK